MLDLLFPLTVQNISFEKTAVPERAIRPWACAAVLFIGLQQILSALDQLPLITPNLIPELRLGLKDYGILQPCGSHWTGASSCRSVEC